MIAAGYTLPFDIDSFTSPGRHSSTRSKQELRLDVRSPPRGWATGRINYTVWSEVFACPECAREIVFVKEALDPETKTVRDEFPCPRCRAKLNKDGWNAALRRGSTLPRDKSVKQVRFAPCS